MSIRPIRDMDEEVLMEWNPWWSGNFELDYVDRDVLEKIEEWLDRREVIPVPGCRRSGKTTLIYIIIRSLLERVDKENILFVKCDDERVKERDLIESSMKKHLEIFNPKGRTYIFLDEVQELEDWDRTVKRIYDLNKDVKIFFSGSRILKGELHSSLAGRFVYFDLFPFSFREFLRAKELEIESRAALFRDNLEIKHHLREYLQWGGFPEIVLVDDEEKKKELLRFYSDSILYRDVIRRSGISKPDKVEKLKNYLLANFTNLLNYNKIAGHLGISPDTVSSYIHHMEESYFVFPVPVFSYSLKKQQVNPKKIYCIDNGLRNAAGFKFSRDLGRLYENTVFLELKRRYEEIYYRRIGGGEVDFIVKQGNSILKIIQVCYDISSAGNREERALLSGMDEFDLKEGIVITGETRKEETRDNKKINYIPLWEWLLVKELK